MKKLLFMLFIVFVLTSCVCANDSLFVVPDFADTTQWVEFEYEDTLKVEWDESDETNIIRYLAYFTKIEDAQPGDQVLFMPNYVERFYVWYTNGRWYTKTTIILPVGRYLFNLSSVNVYKQISPISDACWIEFKMPEPVFPLIPKKLTNPSLKVIKAQK